MKGIFPFTKGEAIRQNIMIQPKRKQLKFVIEIGLFYFVMICEVCHGSMTLEKRRNATEF